MTERLVRFARKAQISGFSCLRWVQEVYKLLTPLSPLGEAEAIALAPLNEGFGARSTRRQRQQLKALSYPLQPHLSPLGAR